MFEQLTPEEQQAVMVYFANQGLDAQAVEIFNRRASEVGNQQALAEIAQSPHNTGGGQTSGGPMIGPPGYDPIVQPTAPVSQPPTTGTSYPPNQTSEAAMRQYDPPLSGPVAPPPMASPPGNTVPGSGSANSYPPSTGGRSSYDYGSGATTTGGGSGGDFLATGVTPPAMAAPMPGQQSEWSQILHESGALQNPGLRIPFDQYPGRGAMFEPYMQARGWSAPPEPLVSDPAQAALTGGQPLPPGPALGPGGENPGAFAPSRLGSPIFSGQEQIGSSPGVRLGSDPAVAPAAQAPNLNSPAVPAQPPPISAAPPPQLPGAVAAPVAPTSPPAGPGMGSPEEMMVLAGQMNQTLRKRFGGY